MPQHYEIKSLSYAAVDDIINELLANENLKIAKELNK
jgi:hypothetical protein